MTTVQYFEKMDVYRVWEYNENNHTINVRYCSLEEVLRILSTKEEK